jgi:hypothetical protein
MVVFRRSRSGNGLLTISYLKAREVQVCLQRATREIDSTPYLDRGPNVRAKRLR